MKATALASCCLLLCAIAPAQDKLVASSWAAASGSVCDPWSCTPAPLAAAGGTPLRLVAAGSVYAPRFLLLSLPPAQCVAFPGIGGSLIVQLPVVMAFQPLTWGHIYVTPPPGQSACGGWLGFGTLPLPANLPRGLVLIMQTLSVTSSSIGRFQLNLSDAVEVTVI